MYRYLIAYVYVYPYGPGNHVFDNAQYEIDHPFGTHLSDVEELSQYLTDSIGTSCTILNVILLSKS